MIYIRWFDDILDLYYGHEENLTSVVEKFFLNKEEFNMIYYYANEYSDSSKKTLNNTSILYQKGNIYDASKSLEFDDKAKNQKLIVLIDCDWRGPRGKNKEINSDGTVVNLLKNVLSESILWRKIVVVVYTTVYTENVIEDKIDQLEEMVNKEFKEKANDIVWINGQIDPNVDTSFQADINRIFECCWDEGGLGCQK